MGVMKPGHVFTIEPMINEGVWQDTMWPDDWTSVTEGMRAREMEKRREEKKIEEREEGRAGESGGVDGG